jgi:hypothetical protein
MIMVLATPHLFADYNNTDKQGRVRLNCAGTIDDLGRQQIQLREGLDVLLYMEERNGTRGQQGIRTRHRCIFAIDATLFRPLGGFLAQ